MATVYILYSPKLNKYYTGSCADLAIRFQQHQKNIFPEGFTTITDDWEIYYVMEDLQYIQARKIEFHIKKMKSKKYIEDLKTYPEIGQKLKALYS
jgi:putative endonuclease